ncbi:MAG: GNAT family N-acetyltransferase [Planctomycetes bacterium]|nr:GNAT family N-acetyltransferase [Planctomycetota bacterium]
MNIRNYQSQDAPALTDIFYDSIHNIATQYYSSAEVHAWAPSPKDYGYWQQRFDAKPPMIGKIDGVIVGFITLEDNGHIDWTYTHPDYQRRGIAGRLYQHLEDVARGKGIRRLHVEASYLAKPFFAQRGFSELCKNDTQRHGQTLTNWSMEKHLD